MLQAVLRALRNHLTLENNFKLLPQLPLGLKGIYVPQWAPAKKRDISRRRIDFIEEVLKYADGSSLHGLSDITKGTESIHAVLKTLKQYVLEGEFENIEATLPHQLKNLLQESIYTKTILLKTR